MIVQLMLFIALFLGVIAGLMLFELWIGRRDLTELDRAKLRLIFSIWLTVIVAIALGIIQAYW